jgi:hypothetical protein
MTKNECLQGYFEMLRRTVANYGVPAAIYADRHTIFQSPNKAKAGTDPKIPAGDTQFGRCLKELGVTLIAARSPQAKGRVERLWATLQGRLPVELAVRGITTLDAANEFLERYIYAYNSEFAVEPSDADSAFLPAPEGLSLDYALCVKEERRVDSGGVFSFGGRSFKAVETAGTGVIPRGAKIRVLASPIFGIKAEFRNVVFDALPFVPPKKAKKPPAPKTSAPPRPAPDSSYWKYGQSLFPRLTFEDSDADVTAMLEGMFLGKARQAPRKAKGAGRPLPRPFR